MTDATQRVLRDNVGALALTQAERTAAIRAGWNDAAWGRPRRAILGRFGACYEVGYAGGLVFRGRQTNLD